MLMTIKRITLWLMVLFLFSGSGQLAWGQAKVGTAGVQFLEVGVSARAVAMGDAFIGVADDATALYYNPAGLTQLVGRQAALSYIALPADIQYSFAGVVLPLQRFGGMIGFAGYGLDAGDIPETDYGHPTGTTRTFGVFNGAFGATYARSLTDHFSVGFTVKFITEGYQEERSLGWGADVGTIYDTGFRNFKIAMVISNFGPDLKLSSNEFPEGKSLRRPYPLPINFKFGAAITAIESGKNRVVVAAEGSHPSDNVEKYQAGVEYNLNDLLMLRGGVRARSNYKTGVVGIPGQQGITGSSPDDFGNFTFTVGGGVQVPVGNWKVRADYAFQDYGYLDQVHRVTLNLLW